MTAYILNPANPANLNRAAAQIGLAARGHLVEIIEERDIDTLTLEKDDILVAGVGYILATLKRHGITPPMMPTLPEPLLPFAQRSITLRPVKDVRNMVANGTPLFLKPQPHTPKLFTGHVAKTVRDLVKTARLDDDHLVETTQPVDMLSEWRCFVFKGTVLGVHRYTGSPTLFPNPDRIHAMIAAWKDAPATYALDVATTETNTIVVEVNDTYALGHYGLSATLYAKIIEQRWKDFYT